jgi:hypothetical protein
MLNKFSKMFSGKKPSTEGVPDIEELIERAEQTPVKIEKNVVPDEVKPLFNSISEININEQTKVFDIVEIERCSPLFAHELKRMILAKLIEAGFKNKYPNGFKIRFGKKIAYDYYFMNFKEQAPLPNRVNTVIDENVELIETNKISKIEMKVEVEIKGNKRVIAFDLILGNAKTRPVAP